MMFHQMTKEAGNEFPLHGAARLQQPVLFPSVDQMKEQLIQIHLLWIVNCIERQSNQGGQVVDEPLGGCETQRVPTRKAQLLKAN
jgi:hypothetical protein